MCTPRQGPAPRTPGAGQVEGGSPGKPVYAHTTPLIYIICMKRVIYLRSACRCTSLESLHQCAIASSGLITPIVM